MLQLSGALLGFNFDRSRMVNDSTEHSISTDVYLNRTTRHTDKADYKLDDAHDFLHYFDITGDL